MNHITLRPYFCIVPVVSVGKVTTPCRFLVSAVRCRTLSTVKCTTTAPSTWLRPTTWAVTITPTDHSGSRASSRTVCFGGVRTFRRQTLRQQCRTFRRHIQLHKDRIPRHRREDVGEIIGVVECGLYAIVCVGETSDIVGVTSVGEASCRRNVRTRLETSTSRWHLSTPQLTD